MSIGRALFQIAALVAICFLLFSCSPSRTAVKTSTASLYGQKAKWVDKKFWIDSLYKPTVTWQIVNESPKNYAYLKNNSDTLIVPDSLWVLYGHKIRYIKIKDNVYPLNPKP